ncbi:Uncharacterized protein TCM_028879 [Theobroma cacao]|uniref:Uncharacterized protein n=1 Tax=Theobroma cacao TaxID=3641 RepID=A0A061GBF1_THECC|nr:Uncharacterized protein TCM_028879 [Theobroma cacao]
MTSRDPRVEKGKEAAYEEEEVPLSVRDQLHIFQQEIQVLTYNLMQRTFDLEAAILSNEKILTEIEFKVVELLLCFARSRRPASEDMYDLSIKSKSCGPHKGHT